MRPKLLFIVLVAIFFNSCAKIVVVNVVDKKPKADGVFYALPKTVIRVKLTVEKVENEAAPFAKFAKIFAPDGKPVCKEAICTDEEKKSYRVKRGAILETFGEPDPNHVYMVKFIGRGQLDQSVTMEWTETGVATGAKASVTNRTTDLAIAGLKLAAGLGTRLGFGSILKDKGKDTERFVCEQEAVEQVDHWVIPKLRKSKAATVLEANYCAIPKVDRSKWKHIEVKKDRIPEPEEIMLERADKAYDSIIKLEEQRVKALGDFTVMEPTAVLEKLDALIAEKLQALYLGTRTITPWDGVFEVRDLEDNSAPKSTPLLGINKTSGFCAKLELAPGVKPIPSGDDGDLISGSDCNNATEVRLDLSFYPEEKNQLFKVVWDNAPKVVKDKSSVDEKKDKSSVDEKKDKPSVDKNEERSFYYRIPAQVKAEVKSDQQAYGTALLSIAQLGIVTSLPAKRNSKTLAYDLKFIESTGALKSFTLGSSGGLDSGVIDQLSSVGNSIVDARNKARDAEAAQEDELNVLRRQQEILKLRDQICELQKKYGLPCEVYP